MKKRLGIGLGCLFGVLALGVAYVELRPPPDFSAEPLPQIAAVKDPAVIGRGRYIATHVAHCPSCHGPKDSVARWELGAQDQLSGGFAIPGGAFGTFYPSNLTPDDETGLGKVSDGQIARAIRTGVLRDGRVGLVMQAAVGDMSDEDLVAVVSYLRSIPPVKNAVPPDELRFVGRALAPLFQPRHGKLVADAPGPSVERGAYLANGPAICVGCHTARDPMKGFALKAPPFSGADEPVPHRYGNGSEFCPPNLTPDPATGHITTWTEDAFVQRFRGGRAYPGSPMQWEAFRGMTDDDLRSIYRYLRTVPPVAHDPGPSFRKVGWKPGDQTT